jgi:hypothetical protein
VHTFIVNLVQLFKVDGIPHLAFLNNVNEVKTSLVGEVPKPILEEEIQSLVKVFIRLITCI